MPKKVRSITPLTKLPRLSSLGLDGCTVRPAELLAVESLAAAELAAERGQLLLALEPDPSPLLLDAMDYENALNLEPAADFLDLLVVASHNPEAGSVEVTKEAEEEQGEGLSSSSAEKPRSDPVVSSDDVEALLRWHAPNHNTSAEGVDVLRYESGGGHLTMVEVPGRSSAWEKPGGTSDGIVGWIDRIY